MPHRAINGIISDNGRWSDMRFGSAPTEKQHAFSLYREDYMEKCGKIFIESIQFY